MSAPFSNLALGASTTSSGFTDGLGRRALSFDREDGTMLERLTLRPELAAFESMIRERLEQIGAIEDERIARPRGIQRDSDGALVVVSEFVPGSRLSDLLDIAADQGSAPGLDAAFGYLLDVLPALCGLHAGVGFAHGTIAPSRTVLTPAGQVVLLDGIYGGALSLLRYSSRKLWSEFSIAVPAGPGTPKLAADTDIGQVVLSSVMLVIGRPLYEDEFPDALPRVMADVLDVAQIRGSLQFSRDFEAFLQRALPLPGRRPYTSADDALIDLRVLATELGLDACRRALVEFIEQMEPTGTANAPAQTGLDDLLAGMSTLTLIEQDDPGDDDAFFDSDLDDDVVEAEIDLEELVEEPAYAFGAGADLEPAAEHVTLDAAPARPDSFQEAAADPIAGPPATSALQISEAVVADAPQDIPGAAGMDPPAEAAPSVRSRRAKRTRSARARKDRLRSAAIATPLATQKTPASAESSTAKNEPSGDRDGGDAAQDPTVTKVQPAEHARKEKSRAQPPAGPELEKPASPTWLVPPDRAAAFEPPIPNLPAVPIVPKPMVPLPAAITPVASGVPLVPPAPFTPVAAMLPAPAPMVVAPPVVPAVPPASGLIAPTAWPPMPTIAMPAPVSSQPVPSVVPHAPAAPLKLKEPAPRPRPVRPLSADIYGPPPASQTPQPTSVFPWKLAAGAIAALVVLIVVGRLLLFSGASSEESAPTESTTASSGAAPASVNAPAPGTPSGTRATTSPQAAATGRVEIETQPAGAQVLLDGKPVGVSPLTLGSVPVGRHSVTLTSTSGTVKRVVRVEAGRTLKIDVPIFSGWVGIFAPFVVEVSEGGRVIGTTEESRLMLSPGRHTLTLTNRELGYRAVETVDIEPGDVRSVTLDPRGTVNLNATPWAEVWIGGKKVGDTPLAGLQLPLGTQELLFRHPHYGERKVTVTVKGNQPVALSVNMMK